MNWVRIKDMEIAYFETQFLSPSEELGVRVQTTYEFEMISLFEGCPRSRV